MSHSHSARLEESEEGSSSIIFEPPEFVPEGIYLSVAFESEHEMFYRFLVIALALLFFCPLSFLVAGFSHYFHGAFYVVTC